MSDLPWRDIALPMRADLLSMRRVADDIRWDFYWARNRAGDPLLVLRCPANDIGERLPRLRSVDVVIQPIEGDENASLILRLADASLVDIFHQLCLDIVASASRAESGPDAVRRAIGRTWRWHHLLRGGGGLLSAKAQMGLLGELVVLERYVLPSLGAAAAVESWLGPLGATQDFSHAGVRIESKACGRTTAAAVRISSEHQLDSGAGQSLFLHLCVFEPVDAMESGGVSVTDVARRLQRVFDNEARAISGRFDALLTAAGFDFDDDYSLWLWEGGERAIYDVGEAFPRLTPSRLPNGVQHVVYDVSLGECGEFVISGDYLEDALRRASSD